MIPKMSGLPTTSAFAPEQSWRRSTNTFVTIGVPRTGTGGAYWTPSRLLQFSKPKEIELTRRLPRCRAARAGGHQPPLLLLYDVVADVEGRAI